MASATKPWLQLREARADEETEIWLRRLRDEDARGVLEAVVLPRLIREPVAPLAGTLLGQLVADGGHEGLVELGCEWRVNSAGGTWASSCVYLAGKGYPRILVAAECVAHSTSCAGAKSCH